MEVPSSGRTSFTPYHAGTGRAGSKGYAKTRSVHRRIRKQQRVLQENRPFIAWDGEGINVLGPGKPQSYVLFGCSADRPIENTFGLGTWDCLDHIISVGRDNPDAIHIGFAFSYDSNMIVQNLSPVTLTRLHKRGYVRLKHGEAEYVITFRKSKFFQVTRTISHGAEKERVTVRIYDIFTFFMTSFEKAYTKMIGPVPTILSEGKAGRKSFTLAEFAKVKRYWNTEIQMVRELAEELRRRVYSAGLLITEWHGPGALATYTMKEWGIREHMSVTPDAVRLAARYAYAAGRFEIFEVGRVARACYGVDLNSAYPAALRLVPSLSEGHWVHEDWVTGNGPKLVHPFGLYYVKLRGKIPIGVSAPSPLFHRDKNHELTFPWDTEGWYWGPEAKQAALSGGTITEAWQYVGWTTRPFSRIDDMFDTRKQWKAEGNSAEMALKLAMNAMTGKAAQRVGWKENGRIPGWHQLEWAGFVTSFTRAKLYEVMRRIPFDQLIAVETDGFYTTMDPKALGIEASTDLGGWSVDTYDEIMYVQSGLAWLRKGECVSPDCTHRSGVSGCAWETKRRGLDPDSFELDHCQEYLHTLRAGVPEWPVFKGVTTRFATMGLALAGKDPKAKHCVWSTDTREISVGRQGKRIHLPEFCPSCKLGLTAYDAPHDLIIAPLDPRAGGTKSFPHSIPWEPEIGHSAYRDRMDEEDLYAR